MNLIFLKKELNVLYANPVVISEFDFKKEEVFFVLKNLLSYIFVFAKLMHNIYSVSYTHLTLPTMAVV